MRGDRYELGRLLGKGGMAEVHEAIARGANGFARRVAVKRLLGEAQGDPKALAMFFDEARTASRLHHAAILQVIDYGTLDGAPFQVLELVDGWDAGTLVRTALARRVPMPPDVALYIATEIAHALSYAHTATDERGQWLGIVHRDVKPSNVLIGKSGDIKLGDFGIALARERIAQTTAFVARGTPSFMSPEQLIGGTVDARTDVFALGCTLHALLVGRSPLSLDTGRAAMLAGRDPELDPTLPGDVRAIVEAATHVDRNRRIATARELAQRLGSALAARLQTDGRTRLLEWLGALEVSGTAAGRAEGEGAAPKAGTTIVASVGGANRQFTTRRAGAQSSQRPAARRSTVFVLAVSAPLVIGAVATAGVLIGRSSVPKAERVDSGATIVPVASQAPPTDASPDPTPSDDGTDPTLDSGRQESRERDASTPKPTSRIATPGSPIQGGCRCDAKTYPRHGLCHPQVMRQPTCGCGIAGTPLCWSPMYMVEADGSVHCPELRRTVRSGRDGDMCEGFTNDRSSMRAKGELDGCDRCADNNFYPHTPNAPCIGVSSATGEVREGTITCK